MIPRLTPRLLFRLLGSSGLATVTGDGAGESERRPGGIAASLTITALTGTTPSITGKVQHSPSPDSVADASAVWLDLLTFTAQTATGAQVQQTTNPYFPRLRGQITKGGTAVTNLDAEIVIV